MLQAAGLSQGMSQVLQKWESVPSNYDALLWELSGSESHGQEGARGLPP